MSQCCEQDQRRSLLRSAREWNGLDYVEVDDGQRTLSAYFLGKLPPELATPAPDLARYLRITGGHRISDIKIIGVEPQVNDDPEKDDVLLIRLANWGDFSRYALELTGLANIDPRYQSASFSFKVACPADMDCASCPPPDAAQHREPLLNYMNKDYAGFRQLLLDRLALLIPDWQERHVPDIGITLVELLAYCADQLSYYQDAVASEAYLDTARQRISVRRHARLVDYRMHEGCNARAWLCLETDSDTVLDLSRASFLTGMNQALAGKPGVLQWADLRDTPRASYEVFEAVWPNPENTRMATIWPNPEDTAIKTIGAKPEEYKLYTAHNAIEIYGWGGEFCHLPQGSTSATLLDAWQDEDHPGKIEQNDKVAAKNKGTGKKTAATALDDEGEKPRPLRRLQLRVGDILIFEQVRHPRTGLSEDADRQLRHAVRITALERNTDELVRLADGRATPLLDIRWDQADALPFALPLSSMSADCRSLAPLALVRGNVILVDAGQSLAAQELGQVPVKASNADCQCEGQPGEQILQAGKFQPKLASLGHAPLVWAEAMPAAQAPASAFFVRDPRAALPQLQVQDDSGALWQPRYDLIDSAAHERHVAVECDNDGRAQLRFGDGELGVQPRAGSRFYARYRAGRPLAGNLGADAITHMVLPNLLSGVQISVRNPLPACGGEAPEPMAQVKLYAPHAFKKQIERAIIAQDYQVLAERNPALQKAAAQLVWTGSWLEAEVALDPRGSEQLAPELLQEVEQFLQNYRRMGHDLHVKPARYVPLDLQLTVCTLPGYQRAHVLARLREVFSNRRLPEQQLGFFHPDNLSFGQGIYLSRIVALAQSQAGVECVSVTRLQRLAENPNQELEQGVLPLQAWEIAQLDNDPDFPEHGKLEILIHGGR